MGAYITSWVAWLCQAMQLDPPKEQSLNFAWPLEIIYKINIAIQMMQLSHKAGCKKKLSNLKNIT